MGSGYRGAAEIGSGYRGAAEIGSGELGFGFKKNRQSGHFWTLVIFLKRLLVLFY